MHQVQTAITQPTSSYSGQSIGITLEFNHLHRSLRHSATVRSNFRSQLFYKFVYCQLANVSMLKWFWNIISN